MVAEQSSSRRGEESLSRRGFMRRGAGGAAAAATAVAGAAGSAGTAGAQTTHTVEMNDQLQFVPAQLTIAPGDTVVWETVGSIGHSVTAYEGEIPEEAEYWNSGNFDSEQAARSNYTAGDRDSGDVGADQTYEHTFEVEGQHDYFCVPHESAGMVASLTVGEGGGTPTGGGGGPSIPAVPETARTLALATMFALLSTLGLAYFFMKYGGNYGTEEE